MEPYTSIQEIDIDLVRGAQCAWLETLVRQLAKEHRESDPNINHIHCAVLWNGYHPTELRFLESSPRVQDSAPSEIVPNTYCHDDKLNLTTMVALVSDNDYQRILDHKLSVLGWESKKLGGWAGEVL